MDLGDSGINMERKCWVWIGTGLTVEPLSAVGKGFRCLLTGIVEFSDSRYHKASKKCPDLAIECT
ncbi:unnamed protein product [Rhodiola kirilowii]